MIEGHKVVTSHEMARIEKRSFDAGASEEIFMEKAGRGIADCVERKALEWGTKKQVTLLIGKGNNGGDAFVAGAHLMGRGFQVQAYHLFQAHDSSPLCQENRRRFLDDGGEVYYPKALDEIAFFPKGLILDGLFGTGFTGQVEGFVSEVIDFANDSGIPIIAIDIPSALQIHARHTAYLGLPKVQFFEGEGFGCIGSLERIDFGLDLAFIHEAKAQAHLLNEKAVLSLLPHLKRTQHKYEAGYVLGVAGSKAMSGAAMLASMAALRMGAGIVRLFHPEGMTANFPYELLHEPWDADRFTEEARRAKSCFIGPGLGPFVQVRDVGLTLPCVIDADGLEIFKDKRIMQPHILTPHLGEMKKLLGGDEVNFEICQQYAEERGATLVLKGAPTVIFHPGTKPLIVMRGDPGMATAGSGDVLTGMLAALLAEGLGTREAAALGVYLHGRAGELAAQEHTSYGVIASDLIHFVNRAIPSSKEVVGE